MKRIVITLALVMVHLEGLAEVCAANLSSDPASFLAICIPSHHQVGCSNDPTLWTNQITNLSSANKKIIDAEPVTVWVSFSPIGFGYSAIQIFELTAGQTIELVDVTSDKETTLSVTVASPDWCKKTVEQNQGTCTLF